MQHKYLLLAFLLASFFTMPVLADDSYFHDPNFSYEQGFIGLYGGVTKGSANFKANPNVGPITTDSFSSNNVWQGGLEFGYGVSTQHWYLGVAIGTQPLPVNMNLKRLTPSGYSLTDKVSMYDYANADLLPGFYIVPQVLFYLRLGGGVGNVNFKQINNTVGLTTFESKDTVGLGRAGAGLDVMVGGGVSVGADYIYTQFARSNTTGVSPVDGVMTTFSITSPKENFIGLHVRYNMGGPAT